MNKRKLLRLIKRNESEKLDFKENMSLITDTDKRELVKDVCAIANSRGGRGYIIIGIEDKTKTIVGCTCEDITEERLQQIITSRCEPPIPITLDEVIIEDKKILIITIYDGYQKPYQVRSNGTFYIRRGSITDIMRKQEIISALQEGLNFSIETCPITRSSPTVLNMNLIKEYFKLKGVEFTEENSDFLLNISSISVKDNNFEEPMCTLGGLLVFSDINSIYVPHNMIKVIDKTQPDKYKAEPIQGTLLDMIDNTEKVLNSILDENYPTYAVVEAIKNAVLYRDYSKINNVIEVIIKKGSITVISPGQFIKKNKSSSFNYLSRNMWIYEKLITLDNKNRFLRSGSGFTVMKKAFKDMGQIKIIQCTEEERVIVIFPRPKHVSY